MNTTFILLAQYGATAIVPIDVVCRDYFQHLDPGVFARRVNGGTLDIPVTRIDPSSKKSAMGVHVSDLAAWIDARRAAAQKECRQMGRM